MRSIVILLLVLPLPCLAGDLALARAEPEAVGISPARLTRVDEVAERYVDAGRVAGMVTLVSRHGRVVQSNARGRLGIDHDEPVEFDSLFRIYSMTKAVTAVAALILYEEGHFQLYDPVSRFLPQFEAMRIYDGGELRPASRPITLHHLFTHMAGLTYGYPPEHPAMEGRDDVDLYGSRNLADFVDQVARLPLHAEPGEAWRYSFATDVLGAVVEHIAGKPLGEFMRERIFGPLGMPDTAFSVPADKLHRLTSSHRWDADKNRMVLASGRPFQTGYRVFPFDSGGAGLVSTAGDYLRFLEMLRSGGVLDGRRILAPKTVKFMTKDHLPRRITDANVGPDHDPTLGLGGGHGLGIGVYIDPVRRGVLSSAGELDWGGASGTVYWLDPVEDLIVIGMIQLFNSPWHLRDDLSVAVYQSLTTSLE